MEFSKNYEKLEELVSQAWLLNDDQMALIQPGSYDQLEQFLDFPHLNSNPLISPFIDGEPAELSLLRVMRDPQFFPFTCKQIFSLDGVEPLTILPFQQIILMELWWRQFPLLVASRGAGKSFILGLYIALKLLFCQGTKVVVTGAGLRQSKIIFEYCERLWHNSPIFRELSGIERSGGRENGPRRGMDRHEFIIGESVATFLPIGDGRTIRGMRATVTIADEFASVNQDTYATVVAGFGAVTGDPIKNVKDTSRKNILKRMGIWTPEMDKEDAKKRRTNQSIISGTAYYADNHFFKYFSEYKKFIQSRGDIEVLRDIFDDEVPPGFDWRDYGIVRLPWSAIPKGFMDEKTIARSRQINATSIYQCEYECEFIKDSDGFFRRSWIKNCTVGDPKNIIEFPSCGIADFTAVIHGNPNRKYIFAVDPASENDKFSIVIIELWPEHRRVVYCWTSDVKNHRKALKKGLVKERNFFAYCARKIYDLTKIFPCERILMDAGGGGNHVREAFMDEDKLKKGELPILEVIVEGDEKYTDELPGLHILEMVQFRDNKWVSEANWGLQKDLQDRAILFPADDSLHRFMAMGDDMAEGLVVQTDDELIKITDTREDAFNEIQEMVDELITIVLTTTPKGLEHWDTPDTKTPGQKKGRLRKDRTPLF